jgi:tetratricopeptide (TPR) repeat protein
MRAVAVVCAVVCLVSASPGIAQDVKDAKAWRDAMDAARGLLSKARKQEAVETYQRAFAAAPSAEHEADTLMHLAEAYESLLDRASAIATYERVVYVYPTYGGVARACHRLGEVYSSVTLLRSGLSEAEMLEGMKEMRPERALAWFERAAAQPAGAWTRASKIAIANIYIRDTNRRAEGMAMLRALAGIDVESITAADYVGPYERGNRPAGTTPSGLAAARKEALRLADAAWRQIEEWGTPEEKAQAAAEAGASREPARKAAADLDEQ